MTRVLVLGGYGNFGARICRALRDRAGIDVLAGSRRAGAEARIDIADPHFGDQLARIAPAIVIHCVGPFQGQDYRVARAAIANGAHYLDLADGREFVANFPCELDEVARAADVLAVSGASTLPALSSAVLDTLVARFERMEEVHIAIAPGQRAPRGAATLAAVFSYCGRPFKWLRDGAWRDAWGWQELKRLRFAGLGKRWAAACDVPDLALLPQRYPGLRTVQFRAALELGAFHLALWLVAALRRAGLPVPLERYATSLDRVANLLDGLGGEHGGMLIVAIGRAPSGKRVRVEWHLTVEALRGPEIPCLAAILLAERLAQGSIAQRGALPCMGLLTLPDFQPALDRWGIRTLTTEYLP